jgi:hypothetical protein
VSDLAQITDYWARCSPFILSQYQDSTRLRGLIESGCAQSNDTEAALFEIVEAFELPTAKGVQLDKIGAWYREGRLGRSDADYRDAITIRAASTDGTGYLEPLAPAGVSAVFGEAILDGAGNIVYDGAGIPMYSARA